MRWPGNRVGRSGRHPHDGLVHVEEINIGSSEALMPVGSVAALAGRGLRGDRHFSADGAKPGQALTLIEAEALEDAGLTGAQSRRGRSGNVVRWKRGSRIFRLA